ncbi:MAG TPA: endo-1,4-beta-xylanase [Tepidisphaeraceae bacterium]|jgi:hypothetical protein|nr:endo-1,4-beta-xylanase [Tepidisphaeraceae bacterium]
MSIKFEIYRDGIRLTQFTPVAPMAMGPESVPLPAEIYFRDGILVLNRADEHALGIALLWDVPGVGTLHLETTRLQHREQPYNLNVELARFRLMKIVQKQEDWNLFDFPKADRFNQRFRDSQSLLADALGKLHEPAEAAKLADQSLAIAIDLSEQLSIFHGELLINRRKQTNAFVKHIVGCRLDPVIQNQKYKDTLSNNFDYAVLPIRWNQLQPEEHTFDASAVDEWADLLSRKRMPIIAGPLIDLTEGEVPDWMYIWEHDFDTLRELAYEYVQKVVTRYRKHVSVWNVCAGLHTNSVFTLSFEQVIELTRLLVAQVKTLLPAARTLVTIKYPFGEHHARSRSSVPPMLYAEMVAQGGISFEAFGLEFEMGVPSPGMFTRDLFQFSCMLDKFSTLGRPLFLTSLCVPGRSTPDPHDRSEGKLDPILAGKWKRPWDPELQAEWLSAAYRLALSKPYIESIAWGNLADTNPTLPAGGLLDDMLKPKPAFVKIQEMREQFHIWQRKV